MSISVKGYHRKPTYEELIQEAVIHPTDTIKYPNRMATQLRNTPQLTRFDDESFLDMNTINSNAMKQTMQQTAVQRALQPVDRPIPSGFERFVTEDESEELQRVIDENEELLEDAKRRKKQRDDYMQGVIEVALAGPDQVADMVSLGSSAAASAGYTQANVATRTKEYEDKTSHNLRGTQPRVWVPGQGIAATSTSSGVPASTPEQSYTTWGSRDTIDTIGEHIQRRTPSETAAARSARPPRQPIIPTTTTVIRVSEGGIPMSRGIPISRGIEMHESWTTTSGIPQRPPGIPERPPPTALGTAARPPASTQSSASAGTTVANRYDIYILLAEAKDRRRLWNISNDIPKVQLSMEISDLIFKINKLRGRADAKTNPLVSEHYDAAKLRLIEIMEMPE